MNITRHVDENGKVRLALTGELDMSTVEELHQHVKHELAAERRLRLLVIDLAETTFCDSTGVGALVKARDAAADHGVSLLVINPSQVIRTVLHVTGVLTILTAAHWS